MDSKEFDVIIIGAGISGLYCAWTLQEAGLSVRVLEGRDRIAGRQWTYRDASVDYVDMGAAYIGHQQTFILDLLKQLGLSTYPQRRDLSSTLALKSGRQTYKSGIPTFWNPLILLDLNNILRLIDDLSKQVPVLAPWDAAHAEEWDRISVKDFVMQHVWTHESAVLAQLATEAPYIADWANISFLFYLHELRVNGGIVAVTSIDNGLQDMKVLGGSGSISDSLASRLRPDTVILQQRVTDVTQTDGGVSVTTETGDTYKAARVISTVPLPGLSNIMFSPPLEDSFQKHISAKLEAHAFKTFMFYKTQFWRDHGLNGELVSESGPISYCIDDTKQDGSHPCIMGFIDSRIARELELLTKDERRDRISAQYARDLGLPGFLEPVDYVEKNWADAEEAVMGRRCCVHTLPPGVITAARKRPGAPHGKVYFAGTEFSLTFKGYMEGALRSGNKTCGQVLSSLGLDATAFNPLVDREEVPYLEVSSLEKMLPSVPDLIMIVLVLLAVLLALVLWWYM